MTDNIDIDDILDQAAQEDELTTELEALKQQAAELAAKNEELERQLNEEAQDDDKQDDETPQVDPVIEELNRKLQALETDVAFDKKTRVVSGMASLQAKYPNLMTNEEVMDAPLLDGAATTAREFLESIVIGGDTVAIDKAVKKIALLNGIKIESVSETLPQGRNVGGNKPDDKVKLKIKQVNELIRKMRTGSLARARAKEKGLI